MDKIAELDRSYEFFMKHLQELVPEGVQDVNVHFLSRLHLLSEYGSNPPPRLARFFHVVETDEKITLFNDQFVVWIVPRNTQTQMSTLVLIGMQNVSEQTEDEKAMVKLETAFATFGVYNTSRIVLRTIEKILADIQENEEVIARFEET